MKNFVLIFLMFFSNCILNAQVYDFFFDKDLKNLKRKGIIKKIDRKSKINYIKLAKIHFKQNSFAKAEQFYKLAIKNGNVSDEVAFRLGVCYIKNEKFFLAKIRFDHLKNTTHKDFQFYNKIISKSFNENRESYQKFYQKSLGFYNEKNVTKSVINFERAIFGNTAILADIDGKLLTLLQKYYEKQDQRYGFLEIKYHLFRIYEMIGMYDKVIEYGDYILENFDNFLYKNFIYYAVNDAKKTKYFKDSLKDNITETVKMSRIKWDKYDLKNKSITDRTFANLGLYPASSGSSNSYDSGSSSSSGGDYSSGDSESYDSSGSEYNKDEEAETKKSGQTGTEDKGQKGTKEVQSQGGEAGATGTGTGTSGEVASGQKPKKDVDFLIYNGTVKYSKRMSENFINLITKYTMGFCDKIKNDKPAEFSKKFLSMHVNNSTFFKIALAKQYNDHGMPHLAKEVIDRIDTSDVQKYMTIDSTRNFVKSHLAKFDKLKRNVNSVIDNDKYNSLHYAKMAKNNFKWNNPDLSRKMFEKVVYNDPERIDISNSDTKQMYNSFKPYYNRAIKDFRKLNEVNQVAFKFFKINRDVDQMKEAYKNIKECKYHCPVSLNSYREDILEIDPEWNEDETEKKEK